MHLLCIPFYVQKCDLVFLYLAICQSFKESCHIPLRFSLDLSIKLSLLDKLSLMGRLISNYCCVVSSFKIFQPTLGRKTLASVEVQRDETTRPKALLSARIQSSTKSSGFTLDNSKQHCSIVLYRIVIFNFISAPNYLKVVICKDFKGTREF